MKRKFLTLVSKLDIILMPLTLLSSLVLAVIRRAGIERMPFSRRIFEIIGVFPISDHYYEPLYETRGLKSLSTDRQLPGINFNENKQIELLAKFTFQDELRQIPRLNQKDYGVHYSYDNGSFGSGDSEFLYNMVRYYKPKRILEVGSGASTLMVKNALLKNESEDGGYKCDHICIEPYEAPWLEELGVKVKRQRVEEVDKELFVSLEAGDILFIDSSHVIRPQGDVLFLYLEIIPSLQPGVLIHLHDVFTPRDYLDEWVVEQVKLWNEQYLLEALLSHNTKLEIIGALNFLKHHYPQEICHACPILEKELSSREPGSFWLLKK